MTDLEVLNRGSPSVAVKAWAQRILGVTERHALILEHNEVTGAGLLDGLIKREDLERLGVPGEPAARIMKAVELACRAGGSWRLILVSDISNGHPFPLIMSGFEQRGALSGTGGGHAGELFFICHRARRSRPRCIMGCVLRACSASGNRYLWRESDLTVHHACHDVSGYSTAERAPHGTGLVCTGSINSMGSALPG